MMKVEKEYKCQCGGTEDNSQKESEETTKMDVLDQYLEKKGLKKFCPLIKVELMEKCLDRAAFFNPVPEQPMEVKKMEFGKEKLVFVSSNASSKKTYEPLSYEDCSGNPIEMSDIWESPLNEWDFSDFVKEDENKVAKMVGDPIFRVRCRFWIVKGFEELKKTFPAGEDFPEFDRTELLNWARAAKLLKDMWLECPYPSATRDAMKALIDIEDRENGWEELFELFPLLPIVQKYAKCNFGASLWGGNWENIASDDLTVDQLKEWYTKAAPMINVYRKFSVLFKWKGYSFSQCLNRARRYSNNYEIRTCNSCKKQRWRGQTIMYRKREQKPVCASTCIYCWGAVFKERVEAKEKHISNAKCFHGDEPWKPVFNCPCGNCLTLINTNVWPLIAKTSGYEVDTLKEHLLSDIQHIVCNWCKDTLEEVRIKGKEMTIEELNKLGSQVSNIQYIKCYGVAIPKGMASKHQDIVNQLNSLIREIRTRIHLKKVDECANLALASRKAKKYDEMFTHLDALETAITNVRSQTSYITTKKEGRFLQFGKNELIEMMLGRGKLAFEMCIEKAMRCNICMSVAPIEGPGSKKMIFTHEHDFEKGNRRRKHMPCMSCPECFDKFLEHTSALGKPKLKCPGYRCGMELKEEHLEKVAPKALEAWRLALFKFEMKKCQNFKFCPNADCGEGFEIKVNCCEATEVECPKCTEAFCPNCNSMPHPGKTCDEVRRERHKECWGEMADYMAKPTKQCPFCLVWIEKNDGCNHMTCTHCQGEFCWLCFGNWKGHPSNCQNAEPVVRQTFKQLYPYQRFKKPKRKHRTKEQKRNQRLRYNNFIQGFYSDPEDFEPDEQLVVEELPESIKRRAEDEKNFQRFTEGLMSYQFYQMLQVESVKRQPEYKSYWTVHPRSKEVMKLQEERRYESFIKGFETDEEEECVKTEAVPDQKGSSSPSPVKELKTGAAA